MFSNDIANTTVEFYVACTSGVIRTVKHPSAQHPGNAAQPN